MILSSFFVVSSKVIRYTRIGGVRMEIIEQIERNKKRPIMLFSLSVLMTAMSVMSIVVGLGASETFNIIVGVIGLFFFLGMMFIFAKDFLSTKPFLQVTEEQITYDGSTFTWEEIREVKLADFGKGKVILLNLQNPQKYWATLSNVQRKIAEMNASNGGHIQINLAKSTNVDVPELLETLQQTHKKATGYREQVSGKKKRVVASFK